MKLALHIGTPKTGTTTLQRWFGENRDALLKQGVRYAQSTGNENHRKLTIYARDTDKPDESFVKFGVKSAEDHGKFRANLSKALRLEIAANKQIDTWLMSNEHLYSKVNSEKMITRLRDLLKPHFETITVYLHLRPQVDLLMSNSSQLARMGQIITREELTRPGVGPGSKFYGYERVLAIWEKVFGAEFIRIIPFRQIPDITKFFVAELGIDTKPLTPMERANSGLDWRSIALSNAVQTAFQQSEFKSVPDFFLDRLSQSERLQPGLKLAQELQARFDESNQLLVKRRKDIAFADLTPDWTNYSEVGNLDLLEAPCHFAPQLGQMVRFFAEAVAQTKHRLAVEQEKLANLQNDVGAAAAARKDKQTAANALKKLGFEPPASEAANAEAPVAEAAAD